MEPYSIIINFAGATALHIACKFNHFDAARHLISRSANVNQQTLQGTTPLHLASENKNLELISHLIEKGASVNTTDNAGETALHYIINSNNRNNGSDLGEKCLLYFLKQKDIDIKRANIVEATPLHLAIVRNQVKMAELLIDSLERENEKKIYVNKSDIGHMTPLMLAIYGKHLGLCDLLLNVGADTNAVISSDNAMDNNLMPLHIACMSNLPTLIEKLIPLTNLSLIRSRLKHSPDKACVFRICHENLYDDMSDVQQSIQCIFKHLKADDFVSIFGQQIPKYYPSDEGDAEQPTYEVFWYLAEFNHILPYDGETPLTHYLRNNWEWVDKHKEGYHVAFEILRYYIENGSYVNKLQIGDSDRYTMPPLVALCCIRKQIQQNNSKLILLFEKIVDYMIKEGSTIPINSLAFVSLSSQPIIYKILCERGAIKPEDIDITEVIYWVKKCFDSKYRLPLYRYNHSISLFYYLYFFGSYVRLDSEQHMVVNSHLQKLYDTYSIRDQKLGKFNASLVNDSLLKQCRIFIRKHLIKSHCSSSVNINTLIKELPGLPLDLYDFLCINTLTITMKK